MKCLKALRRRGLALFLVLMMCMSFLPAHALEGDPAGSDGFEQERSTELQVPEGAVALDPAVVSKGYEAGEPVLVGSLFTAAAAYGYVEDGYFPETIHIADEEVDWEADIEDYAALFRASLLEQELTEEEEAAVSADALTVDEKSFYSDGVPVVVYFFPDELVSQEDLLERLGDDGIDENDGTGQVANPNDPGTDETFYVEFENAHLAYSYRTWNTAFYLNVIEDAWEPLREITGTEDSDTPGKMSAEITLSNFRRPQYEPSKIRDGVSYLVCFVKPKENFLFVDISGDRDYYAIDQVFGDKSNIKGFPGLELLVNGKPDKSGEPGAAELGYVAVMGWTRRDDPDIMKTKVTCVPAPLGVEATCDAESVKPGDELEFTLTFTPADLSTYENSSREISSSGIQVTKLTINDNPQELSNLVANGDGTYTLSYKATDKDCISGEVTLEVEASVSYDVVLTLSSGDKVTTKSVSENSAKATCSIAPSGKIEYVYLCEGNSDEPVPEVVTKESPLPEDDTTYYQQEQSYKISTKTITSTTVDTTDGQWTFDGWYPNGEKAKKCEPGSEYSFTISGGGKAPRFIGYWKFTPKYTVTYDLAEGTTTTPPPDGTDGKYEYRELEGAATPTIAEPTLTGYDFHGWTWDDQTSPNKTVPDKVTEDATYTANWEEKRPVIDVTKDADKTVVDQGDIITYTVTIDPAETGGLVKNVKITDPKLDFSATDPGSPSVKVGSSDVTYAVEPSTTDNVTTFELEAATHDMITVTYFYKVTDDDVKAREVKNTATVEVWNTNPQKADEKTATQNVPAGTPTLTVTKVLQTVTRDNVEIYNRTVTPAEEFTAALEVGDALTWTITAANNGTATAYNLNLSDTLMVDEKPDPSRTVDVIGSTSFDLAVDATQGFTATYTVQKADAGHKIANQAVVKDSSGNEYKDETTGNDVATHTVTYAWGAPAAAVTDKYTLPTDSNKYAKGETYSVDLTEYAPVNILDEYGNVTKTYTFSGWNDPNKGTMGTKDVTIEGTWDEKDVEVKTWTVTVNYLRDTGAVLQDPAVERNVINNSTYSVADKIPSELTVNGSRYTWVRNEGDLTGTIAGDVVINAVYTRVIPDRPDPGPGGTTTIPDPPTPLTPGPAASDPGTTITDVEVPLTAPGLNAVDHFDYIKGYENGTMVRPGANITRAEVATIFFRLMTKEFRSENWSTENSFSDVSDSIWYNNAISTCAKAGILSGYPDGTFRPNQSITREEFAAIAARFASDEVPSGGMFSDIAGRWSEHDIERAAAMGWIKGNNGKFRPTEPITRAEVITTVNRMLDRVPDADHMLPDMQTFVDNTPDMWWYADVQEAANSHDYERGEDGVSEIWTELLPPQDWAALEKEWASAADANVADVMPGGGSEG